MSTSPSQTLSQAAKAHLPLSRSGSAPLRSSLRRVVARRPAMAWSLALLFMFKAFVCLAAILVPDQLDRAGGLDRSRRCSACGWRLPGVAGGAAHSVLGFELLAACGTLVNSALVAHASTHGGMMIAAFSYPWIAIYSAHFFERRVVVAQGTLISLAFGVALLLGGLPHVGIYWMIVTVTIWSICIVLGRLSESLRRQADTDTLTGLLNRNGFMAAAMREHAIAQRSGNRLTLAMLDLDGFKQINDLRGHTVGDRVLADLGKSWRERLRTGDILARHGGDEFVLLLPATTPEGASAVLDRLRVEDLPVTWSVGIGEWLPRESLGECIARADADLYSVKNAMRVRDARAVGV